jgi:hypothetical protein
MSDSEDTSTVTADDLVEKIHEIQERIFEREDHIEELVDASEEEESLLDAVEESRLQRRSLHLRRLRTDWDRMVARSRDVSDENDFELAAALVHFIGDILLSQTEGTDIDWIEELREYLRDHRAHVN